MADISKINLGGVEYDIRDQKLKEDVEKKADKTYVDEEAERVVGYAEEVADNAEKAAKKYADDNKVAKVDGKQLSTEDFTTVLKQKLDGLTNYDDADVRSAITELQNNLDAIVNGDATSAIDSIQEILAFLSTITDTQTLAGIVADLKQYVDDKVAAGGSGGITEEKEVYIGSEEPPVGTKVWIDPTGTPSQPSAGNGGIYFFPLAMATALANSEDYYFSEEEARKYREAWNNASDTLFVIRYEWSNGIISEPVSVKTDTNSAYHLDILLLPKSMLSWEGWDGEEALFYVEEEDGTIRAFV